MGIRCTFAVKPRAFENDREQLETGLYPSCVSEGSGSPLDERKGGYTHSMGDAMCVTYADLIQIGICIVALIGLCSQSFGEKRNSRHYRK